MSNTDFFKCMPTRLDYFSKTSEECHAKYKKPCDYAVRSFALKIIFNLKLVIIWNNTIKSINEINKHRLDFFENRVYCKPIL